MKLLRVLLAWILMLAVPASSWAALNLSRPACPMHEAMASMSTPGATPSATDPDEPLADCCAADDQGGMACTQKCPVAPVALPVLRASTDPQPHPQAVPTANGWPVLEQTLPTLWRPPRQV